MRLSWIAPEDADKARELLKKLHGTWDRAFGRDDAFAGGDGLDPHVAEHLARRERVLAVKDRDPSAARARFADSPHAVERAALLWDGESVAGEVEELVSLLQCPVDPLLCYAPFVTRLMQTGLDADPDGTVRALEGFVAACEDVADSHPDWPARTEAARLGLAELYVRVDRPDDAHELFRRRHDADEGDVTVAISAARVFLQNGDVARAVRWLELGVRRADTLGRGDLSSALVKKLAALRGRMS